jgi:hypothetical protein
VRKLRTRASDDVNRDPNADFGTELVEVALEMKQRAEIISCTRVASLRRLALSEHRAGSVSYMTLETPACTGVSRVIEHNVRFCLLKSPMTLLTFLWTGKHAANRRKVARDLYRALARESGIELEQTRAGASRLLAYMLLLL